MKLVKILILVFIFKGFAVYADPLKVVATTGTLASIAKEIGGKGVVVSQLVDGSQDLHYVTPRPSMIRDMQDADFFISVGMSLDAWVDGLRTAARNKLLFDKQPGFLDASLAIERLDVPTTRIDGGMGDIHIEGNPHYYLDPLNSVVVAQSIADRLCQLDPTNAAYYRSRLVQFKSEISAAMPIWMSKLNAISDYKLMTYHTTWRYFAKRFNLNIVGQLEPKPGIPPTAKHLLSLKQEILKTPKIIVVQADFHPARPAQSLVAGTPVRVVTVATEVDHKAGQSYIEFMTEMINAISNYPQK